MSEGRKFEAGGRKTQIPPRCARPDDNGSLKVDEWKLRKLSAQLRTLASPASLLSPEKCGAFSQISLDTRCRTESSLNHSKQTIGVPLTRHYNAHSLQQLFHPNPLPAPPPLFYLVQHGTAWRGQTTAKTFLTSQRVNNRVNGCKWSRKAEDSETVAQFSRHASAAGQLSVVGLRVVVGVPAPVWGSRAS